MILGDLHAPPNRDPMGEVLKRPAMVPLTNATLAYTFKGQPEVADVGTIIVNRHVTEWIEPAVEEQTESFPGRPRPDVPPQGHERPRDRLILARRLGSGAPAARRLGAPCPAARCRGSGALAPGGPAPRHPGFSAQAR